VPNILDWGKDGRLAQIREALDEILEEARKEVTRAARARPPSVSSGASFKRPRL
jgi:hypothetical protein